MIRAAGTGGCMSTVRKLKLMEAWVICDTLSVCVRGVTNRKGVDLFELGIGYIVILRNPKISGLDCIYHNM